ncbi:hypothetical protein K439DRAFT_1397162 [Ramaria rubella]|nr:hypothetical protein K439DRAFT_1397162 [Ramaria rubella]
MPALVDIRFTFGVCFVALLISMALYGATLFQTYSYYMRFPKDTLLKKSLVAVVCVINTFQTVLISHGIYYYLILNYGNPVALEEGVWSFILEVVVTDLVACTVQMFFASQVFYMGKGARIITATILIFAIIQLAFSCAFVVKGFLTHGAFSALLAPIFKTFLLGHLIASLAADILITASLSYYLQVGRTGHSQTEYLIKKLLIYTINRGILTGLAAFLELVLYLASPSTFLFIGVHFITSKLYTVSFLATLNIRRSSRDADIILTSISGSSAANQRSRHGGDFPGMIHVSRTVDRHMDDDLKSPRGLNAEPRASDFAVAHNSGQYSDDDLFTPK